MPSKREWRVLPVGGHLQYRLRFIDGLDSEAHDFHSSQPYAQGDFVETLRVGLQPDEVWVVREVMPSIGEEPETLLCERVSRHDVFEVSP
jgi:hypothetical protein